MSIIKKLFTIKNSGFTITAEEQYRIDQENKEIAYRINARRMNTIPEYYNREAQQRITTLGIFPRS